MAASHSQVEAVTTMTLIILAALLPPITATDTAAPVLNQDIQNAVNEMRKANYHTFVMLLINLSPADLFAGNLTFFMPSDRSMSQNHIPNVTDFLLRHSVPSPMLFNHLAYLPSDATLPSLHQNYAIRISNYGRTSLFLNNARLTSPNLCLSGMSVRCHGIDDVLSLTSGHSSETTSCTNTSDSDSPLPPHPPPSPSADTNQTTTPAVGPEPAPAPQPSWSPQLISKSSPKGFMLVTSLACLAMNTFLLH